MKRNWIASVASGWLQLHALFCSFNFWEKMAIIYVLLIPLASPKKWSLITGKFLSLWKECPLVFGLQMAALVILSHGLLASYRGLRADRSNGDTQSDNAAPLPPKTL